MDKVYLMKRNISHMLKTPNNPHMRYHQYGDFDVLERSFHNLNSSQIATCRSVLRRKMIPYYTGSPVTLL